MCYILCLFVILILTLGNQLLSCGKKQTLQMYIISGLDLKFCCKFCKFSLHFEDEPMYLLLWKSNFVFQLTVCITPVGFELTFCWNVWILAGIVLLLPLLIFLDFWVLHTHTSLLLSIFDILVLYDSYCFLKTVEWYLLYIFILIIWKVRSPNIHVNTYMYIRTCDTLYRWLFLTFR